jgi:hypothetical protein
MIAAAIPGSALETSSRAMAATGSA